MSSRSLPSRPNLVQLKIQVSELRRRHRAGKRSAAARVAAHLPQAKGKSLQEILARRLTVADAQLVVAREYGFRNWPKLKHHVETSARVARFKPHPCFDAAVAAMDNGKL